MKNLVGPPVEGDDFFGREKDENYIWNKIKEGNSILLSAPRRVGKTSLAKRQLLRAKNEKWRTLEIDLEEIKSEEGFIKKFVEELEKQTWWGSIKKDLKKSIKEWLNSITLSGEYEGIKGEIKYNASTKDPYDNLNKLLHHDKPMLIMFDELTVLLSSFIKKENGKAKVEDFLDWLRSFRLIKGTQIRWIFCSSIGLENFTNQYGLSDKINDLLPYKIDAFTDSKAKEFINKLSESYKLNMNDAEIDYFLNKLGWYLPFFIQILFEQVNRLHQVEDYDINTKTIDMAYDNLLSSKHFNTWDERLEDYGENEKYARILLNRLAQNKTGESRENLQNEIYSKLNDIDKANLLTSRVINMLLNDGYLIEKSGRYAFRSPLLRDFWFNRFLK